MPNFTMSTLQPANASHGPYSPIVLNNQWSQITRLILTLLSAAIGTLSNAFFVASFFIDKDLRKYSLVYMACAGASDFLVTSTVLPTSAVVILSGEWNTEHTCFLLQAIFESCTYSYVIFSMLAALESFYKFCEKSKKYHMKLFLTLQAIFISLICIFYGFGGVYLNLDYDYCKRRHDANPVFKATTLILFEAIPFVITAYALVLTSYRIRNQIRTQNHIQRAQLEHQRHANNVNIASFLLFMVSWAPYLMLVHFYPNASDSRYYYCAWIGVARSVITSVLYGTFDKYFRRAFSHLFNYVFCKNSLSGSYADRPRNRVLYTRSPPEVRVHIMHQAVNTNSPQRAGSSGRDVLELR